MTKKNETMLSITFKKGMIMFMTSEHGTRTSVYYNHVKQILTAFQVKYNLTDNGLIVKLPLTEVNGILKGSGFEVNDQGVLTWDIKEISPSYYVDLAKKPDLSDKVEGRVNLFCKGYSDKGHLCIAPIKFLSESIYPNQWIAPKK
jgi:hypothetical protein